ncbi:MAG TPA: AAA family ATPase [Chitinispirillaceae bacterium]|nr:AAA family ATPase [Chitinispirillaceae bacterium]
MIYFTIKAGEAVELPATGNIPRQVHLFNEDSINAVNAALAANRPLLVRGEPGTGKTQLARAVAKELGWAYVHESIDSSSVASDLLYRADSITRLGEAQVMALSLKNEEKDHVAAVRAILDEKQFIHPGPLWWAFNWELAQKQATIVRTESPPQPDGGDYNKGCVLLIDEIDKADTDLPNGLLEAFGNGRFRPPAFDKPIFKNDRPLLVVITTNEERSLPDAFLRRCLVLLLKVDEDTLIDFLVARGKAHFDGDIDEIVLREAAVQLQEDRIFWKAKNLCAPGVAEYLDLVRAVKNMISDTGEQMAILRKIKKFVLKKHPEALT